MPMREARESYARAWNQRKNLQWLMRHRAEARANPSACLPWTYPRGEPSAELEVEAVARAA